MKLKTMWMDLTEQLALQCSEGIEIELYREYTTEVYYGRQDDGMDADAVQRGDGYCQRVGAA
jgi:hypothetical protein